MEWSNAVEECVKQVKKIEPNIELVQRIVTLIDLTSLNQHDTEDDMAFLSEKACTPFGYVAALCVCPKFVRMLAASFVDKPVKIATVANFPEGQQSLESVLIDIGRAIEDGAQEIDVVFPYQRYLAQEKELAWEFIEACKAACGEQVLLKVILETGVLVKPEIIADVSYDVISAGADFIKTSTGKVPVGATLEAAATILMVLKKVTPKLTKPVGIKFSGGIRTLEKAALYLSLADQIMGPGWAHPRTCRFGASHLVDEIIKLSHSA